MQSYHRHKNCSYKCFN